jgi:DNA-binding SARP family transcriptional activator
MRVRLLGPVDVVEADRTQPVAGLRRKAALAVLGLAAGRWVSTEHLIDVVWDGRPPSTALNALQSHISYLRGVLGNRETIVARPPGYLLDLGADATDLQVHTRLVEAAARTDDPAAKVRHLRAALDLWRGRPLVDVAGLSWLDGQADRLDALRLEATQALLEARLALREHTRLVPELADLTGQHPYHEQFHRLLMTALYRSGRQAEALAVYQRLRKRLGDELGIDPGAEIRELEAAILRHDPAILRHDPAVDPAPATTSAQALPVPRQLPAEVAGFTGRVEHLADLDAWLDLSDEGRAMVVSAVSGTAGIGKTTLAVHWAHRVAGQFPDGQLYVDLHGFDPTGAPTDPSDALRGFVEALAGPGTSIPTGLPAQAALYRSLLAGKRVLVVLDNARDVEQVRPLLPGTASCLVVVTSRDQLHGLVADGANPLVLDLLTLDEARDLLQRRLGKPRVTEEPGAVDDIIDGCSRLPLALAVAAARAAVAPQLPLELLAAELRDSHDALSTLDGGDAGTDVRAVFSWSYRQLSPDAGRLFRCLGLHPGPDVTAAAAASLAAVPLSRVRPLLAELTRANLVVEHVPGRYTSHDLLRAYAAEQACGGDRDEQRAGILRMLDHYLHTAFTAVRLSEPARDPVATLAAPQPGAVPEPLADHDGALAWLEAEHRVLVRLIAGQAGAGHDTHAWQLGWAISNFLIRRGTQADYRAVQQAAIAAGERLDDLDVQARARCNLANAYSWQDRFDESADQLRQALELSRRSGNRRLQGDIEYVLGHLAESRGDLDGALGHAERARDLYHADGGRQGYAYALDSVGRRRGLLGHHEQSLAICQKSLALLEELDDRHAQAVVWRSIAFAHRHLGHHDDALDCYRRAIRMHRELADRDSEADSLEQLGDLYESLGDLDAARQAWQDALEVLAGIDHTVARAEELSAKLARVTPADY